MPAVTFDGKSLFIDGKRTWVISASLHFQRFPRDTWLERIHAARLAGFNTIETPVYWNRIEPRPGAFDFKGDNDVRHFLKLVQEAGMHAIIRPGPYVGAGWDLGGIPSWLLAQDAVTLRAPNQPFLEATGRYFTALAKQVKDLQANTPGGGPIILIQNEAHWTCDHPEAAEGYLAELARYLREAGLTLPRINANNLWQGVEGEIDGWTGEGEMFAILRQLNAVRPDQPQMVIDFGPIRRPRFGENPPEPTDPLTLQRQLGEILASAGQYNLSTFACGSAEGFWAGQSPRGEHTMLAPSQELFPAIDEHGRPTSIYHAVRRISQFASSFSRVFANHHHDTPPILIDPAPRDGTISGRTVTHLRGSQGSVLFVFSPNKSKPGTLPLLMSDGSSLRVPLGNQQVHWCLLNTHLTSRATLDYATLCALFFANNTLVVFGPSGATGAVSINGTIIELEIPSGRRPVTARVDDVTICAVSEELADETFFDASRVYVGISALTHLGEPLPGSSKTHTEITADGSVTSVTTKVPDDAAPAKLPAIDLETWELAPDTAHIDGSSPRYAQIKGPDSLPALGAPQGYGWYRINLRSGATRKIKLCAPEMEDRLQIFLDGQPIGVLGDGPGAEQTLPLSLKKGTHTLVGLADNMGFPSGGSWINHRKGLYGHLFEAATFRTPKPKLETAEPFDLLAWRSPLFRVREGDQTHPSRITWSFAHRKHSPLVIDLPPFPARAVVLLNDDPVDFIDANQPRRLYLATEQTKRGNNVLQLALHTDEGDGPGADARVEEVLAILSNTKFLEAASPATDKGEWGFAKWEAPGDNAYQEVAKSNLSKEKTPSWWRTFFNAPAGRLALSIDLSGMTKGVVFLNGHNLGRYFSQTASNKKVPPQLNMPLPRPYLKEKGNELVIFDEHGGNPARVKMLIERA
jgi:hypothetical protein